MRELKVWKKVYENDLPYVIEEFKESINEPALIFLTGEMGVGKTTFVRYYVGEKEFDGSPTYQLINDYGDIVHADFYRLKEQADLTHLEFNIHTEEKNFI